jgi:multidrug efflux pump subunit AcrA (membrane-fusion protein)
MKTKKIIITLALIIVGIGGALALQMWLSSMKPEPQINSGTQTTRLVQTKLVSYQDITSYIEIPGRLVSGRTVDIISEVQGEILPGDIPLKKGQTFTKDQLLCTIYDTEQILTLKASKSRFLNSLANSLADIKFDYPDKYKAILDFFNSIDLDKKIPNLPDIQDNSLKTFLAGRDILSQYYTIKVSEERLEKHYIRAPFTGTFIDVSLESGGIANPGTRIARIIKTDILELEVPIEVEDLKWVKKGDQVTVLNEYRTQEWQGKVVRISEFLDPNTQSASVFVQINNNPKHPVFAGMYLIAKFANKTVENAMEIPRQAVFNQNQVFVVEGGVLKKMSIHIEKINTNTLIFNGLETGTKLVVEPLINVREGTVVETSI